MCLYLHQPVPKAPRPNPKNLSPGPTRANPHVSAQQCQHGLEQPCALAAFSKHADFIQPGLQGRHLSAHRKVESLPGLGPGQKRGTKVLRCDGVWWSLAPGRQALSCCGHMPPLPPTPCYAVLPTYGPASHSAPDPVLVGAPSGTGHPVREGLLCLDCSVGGATSPFQVCSGPLVPSAPAWHQ